MTDCLTFPDSRFEPVQYMTSDFAQLRVLDDPKTDAKAKPAAAPAETKQEKDKKQTDKVAATAVNNALNKQPNTVKETVQTKTYQVKIDAGTDPDEAARTLWTTVENAKKTEKGDDATPSIDEVIAAAAEETKKQAE